MINNDDLLQRNKRYL